jgi:hypothetical protein
MQPATRTERPHPWITVVGMGAFYAVLFGLVLGATSDPPRGVAPGMQFLLETAVGMAGVALPIAVMVGGVGGMVTAPLIYFTLRRLPGIPLRKAWLVGFCISSALLLMLLLPIAILIMLDDEPMAALKDTAGVLSIYLFFPGLIWITASVLLTHYYYPKFFRPKA